MNDWNALDERDRVMVCLCVDWRIRQFLENCFACRLSVDQRGCTEHKLLLWNYRRILRQLTGDALEEPVSRRASA